MKYLMENETAFDTGKIGFPSIQGCHAIIYQTKSGLYGFHVAGGSGDAKWPINGRHFASFIRRRGGPITTATRLYGVTYVGNNQRGYAVNAFKAKEYKRKWKEELVAFATALHYSGKISGYDLHKTLCDGTSAYVEFTVNGSKCDVSIEKWTGPVTPTRGANPNLNDHMGRAGTMDNPTLINLPTVVTTVVTSGLQRISKEKLR